MLRLLAVAVGEGVQAVYQQAMGEAGSDQAQQQQPDGGLQYITNNGAQVRTVGETRLLPSFLAVN
jgi:hypothetical protein